MNDGGDSYPVILHCAVSLRIPWDVELPAESLFPIRASKVPWIHRMVNPKGEVEKDFEKRASKFKKRVEKRLADKDFELNPLLDKKL